MSSAAVVIGALRAKFSNIDTTKTLRQLNIGTEVSDQKCRLLLYWSDQSGHGLHCLPFFLYILVISLASKTILFHM